MPAPRVTGQDAPDGEIASFEEPVFPERFHPITGAGRCVAALSSQPGGQYPLVDLYQQHKGISQYFTQPTHCHLLKTLHPGMDK
jgi:hypothetical protein